MILMTSAQKIIIYLFLTFASAEFTHAALPPDFKISGFLLDSQIRYYTTNTNFSENGDDIDLPSGFSYSEFVNANDLSYNLNGSLIVGTGFNYAYAFSENSVNERSNGALTEARLFMQKYLSIAKLQIIPEGLIRISLIENELSGDEIEPSDGANSYRLGSWLTYDIDSFKVYGFLGYQHRDNGYSDLLPWTVGLSWNANSLHFFGEAFGFESIKDDEDTDTVREIERRTHNNTVNGGSSKYNTVNPSLISGCVGLIYNINSQFAVSSAFAYDFSGASMASGQTFSVGLKWGLDISGKKSDIQKNDKRKSSKNTKKSRRSNKNNEDFSHTLEDDYDESLFQDEEEP